MNILFFLQSSVLFSSKLIVLESSFSIHLAWMGLVLRFGPSFGFIAIGDLLLSDGCDRTGNVGDWLMMDFGVSDVLGGKGPAAAQQVSEGHWHH